MNLVLVFPGEDESSLVRKLAARKHELDQENTEVLIILAGRELGSLFKGPFPVLLDEERSVSTRFGVEEVPAVFIADQYGEIYSVHGAEAGSEIPTVDETLASLRHINAACPE